MMYVNQYGIVKTCAIRYNYKISRAMTSLNNNWYSYHLILVSNTCDTSCRRQGVQHVFFRSISAADHRRILGRELVMTAYRDIGVCERERRGRVAYPNG